MDFRKPGRSVAKPKEPQFHGKAAHKPSLHEASASCERWLTDRKAGKGWLLAEKGGAIIQDWLLESAGGAARPRPPFSSSNRAEAEPVASPDGGSGCR
ncbi:hypothetical protein KM043_014883 [Ampulex compressa]|nr:hypothetical protein KM043_014883 [Ampulex compressa]